MYPSYLNAHTKGNLEKVSNMAYAMLELCCICPRQCRVNRLKGQKGFCKTGLNARVYSFMPHHGEEPPISGIHGSGAIFFSCCNMACSYCQNYEFSQKGEGREVSAQELAGYMIELQNAGCHNINLVTPTHIMPQILAALKIAILQGLRIPLVYNTSSYELPESIELLDGIIDIYLADLRYADSELSENYSCAPDYPAYSQKATKEMQRQVGVAKIDKEGIIKKGLIIRHLVLPHNIGNTEKIMEFISSGLTSETYLSLMSQYLPCYKASAIEEISRRITQEEYAQAKVSMQAHGLHNGWVQEDSGLERFAGTNIKRTII